MHPVSRKSKTEKKVRSRRKTGRPGVRWQQKRNLIQESELDAGRLRQMANQTLGLIVLLVEHLFLVQRPRLVVPSPPFGPSAG